MLCELCASMWRTRVRTESGDTPAATAAVSAGSCDVCQRPLTGGAASRFVSLLSRMARFGLTGENLLVRKA